MKSKQRPYRIFPLGDSALTIEYGQVIDPELNEEVIARFREWQEHPIPGMTEALPAYSSLTVYYDILTAARLAGPGVSAFDFMKTETEKRLMIPVSFNPVEPRVLSVPVCYEPVFAPDISRLAEYRGISVEEVIREHTSGTYQVYMLGFLPGFAYMGELSEKISHPRKPAPEPTAAGSVGIAGRQTGIYPLDSPGGWQIIGRTPVQVFDRNRTEPSFFRAGDRVRFFSITKSEFENRVREKIDMP